MDIKQKYAIIGSGTLGSAVAQKLHEIDLLKLIHARSDRSYKRISEYIPKELIIRNIDDIKSSENIIITVNDSSIKEVVKEIAKFDLNDKFIFHTSGVLKKDVLDNLEIQGAKIAAVHPYQTFHRFTEKVFDNVAWGIDSDKDVFQKAEDFVKCLGGNAIPLKNITEKEKALYHLSAVLASNISVIMLEFAKSTALSSGIDPKKFIPKIVETTIENVFESWNENSQIPLTGPFARGDVKAVKMHYEALKNAGLDADSYLEIAKIASKTAYENELIDERKYNELMKLHFGANNDDS
jgi:predicted short-subunit dehydrogenase-like oxidoreductase (DUF2520 family)